MDLAYEEYFRPRRRYDVLIKDLKSYFNSESNIVTHNKDKNVDRIIDQAEVNRLNCSVKQFHIEKGNLFLENTQFCIEAFIKKISDYSNIEQSIESIDCNDKELFYQYLGELKENIQEITSFYTEYKKESADKEEIFEKIRDYFKKIISSTLVKRFVCNIKEKMEDAVIYDSLLISLNNYMKKLGIYTSLLDDNYRDRNSKFSPQDPPEYTDDKKMHNRIKEIITLPYCFVWSKNGEKINQVTAEKGKIIVYSNSIEK